MKVAILDDYQSLSTKHFTPLLVDLSHYPDTLNPRDAAQRSALIQRLQPYHAIVTMRERTPFPAEVIQSLPHLQLLLTQGTRNLALDLDACSARGVVVAGTTSRPPGVHSTVQHTWALILGLARHIPRDDARIKDPSGSGWQGSPLATNISRKTLGIVGLGKLGAQVARIGVLAFEMRVIAWSSNLTQEKADEQAVALGLPRGTFEAVSDKTAFFERADVVSVHQVLSERSRGVVGRAELESMRAGAILVNTARGPVVDEGALLETLEAGRIRGAALDVFDVEPLPRDSPWRTTAWGCQGRSEVVLSPHMGYGEEEQLNGWYKELAGSLQKWLAGEEVPVRLN